MSDVATSLRSAPTPRIEYRPFDAHAPLPRDVLGAVAFRETPLRHNDPRCVRVGLKPLLGADIMEVWHASGPVSIRFRRHRAIRGRSGSLLGAIEVDERQHGGIAGAAEFAYAALSRFVAASRHPHLLRIWNYLDGINHGSGDDERYKLFCMGRTAGWGAVGIRRKTAFLRPRASDGETAIRRCRCIGLPGVRPGVPLENPRQISAYRYPREYGPHRRASRAPCWLRIGWS